jgi:hypothetical protein
MKALITLATLTLLALSANAGYQRGTVVPSVCGTNVESPNVRAGRFGLISRVCQAAIYGSNYKTPLFTVELTLRNGAKNTYVYQQVSVRPIMTAQAVGSFLPTKYSLSMVGLQIIGEVNSRGQYSPINFIRAPDVSNVIIGRDQQGSLKMFSGQIALLGDASASINVDVKNFSFVLHRL